MIKETDRPAIDDTMPESITHTTGWHAHALRWGIYGRRPRKVAMPEHYCEHYQMLVPADICRKRYYHQGYDYCSAVCVGHDPRRRKGKALRRATVAEQQAWRERLAGVAAASGVGVAV